jgi:hypothetical protein
LRTQRMLLLVLAAGIYFSTRLALNERSEPTFVSKGGLVKPVAEPSRFIEWSYNWTPTVSTIKADTEPSNRVSLSCEPGPGRFVPEDEPTVWDKFRDVLRTITHRDTSPER